MANLEECIGFELKITKNVMENEYNKYLKEFNISSEQGALLAYVNEFPGSTQTQLSEGLLKDKTTITRMIDTLVKKGKLERRSSEDDRRVFKIYVSLETEKLIEELSPIFDKRDEELKQIIGEEDYQTSLKVLKIIREYYQGLNK